MKRDLFLTILCDQSGDAFDEYVKWTEHQRIFSPKTDFYKESEHETIDFRGSPLLLEKKQSPVLPSDEERKVSLDLASDELTLREFLRSKSPRIWQKVKGGTDLRIKIQHL